MSDPIRVWVRSLGEACRVSIDSLSGATIVLDRLSQSGAFVGLNTIDLRLDLQGTLPNAWKCNFSVPGSSERTLSSLEKVLAEAEGVKLMNEPGR